MTGKQITGAANSTPTGKVCPGCKGEGGGEDRWGWVDCDDCAGTGRIVPLDPSPEPVKGPLTCDDCCRFVSVKDAHLLAEYGDYGQHYNTEVFCPRCTARMSSSVITDKEGTA